MDRRIRNSRAFEDGIVVQTYPGGKYDVLVLGRTFPYDKLEANRSVKNIQTGDKVRICKSGRLHEIIGRDGANNINSSTLPFGDPTPPPPEDYVQGLWPIGQANPSLDCMARYSNALIVPSTSAASTSRTIGPGNSDYSPLGLVTFQSEAGAVTVIYHIKYDSGAGLYTNTLTAFSTTDLSNYWEVPLGDPYASIPTPESVAGNRQGWLFHCATTKFLWAVGFGSHTNRKTIYVVPEAGAPVVSLVTSESVQQSTLDYGYFLKGWFSPPSRPLIREETSDVIRAFKVGGTFPSYGIGESWNILVEDLLPGYDIATSYAPELTGFYPEGRWPINGARKTAFIWVSGSKKLANSNSATVLQVFQGVFSTTTMCGYSQQADTRTVNHKAAVIAIDLTTGQEKWRRVIEATPSVTFDYSAIAAQESAAGLTSGGVISGGAGVESVWPNYDSSTGFYNNVFTYRGLASEDTLTISPTGPFTFPRCSDPFGDVPVIYDAAPFYVVPWIGPDWGGGDVYTAPSACGAFVGPKYNYFAPGHIKLLPDDLTPPTTPEISWSADPQYIREDMVGGCSSCDTAGWHWTAFAQQETFVNSYSRIYGEYVSQSETFTPSGDPNVCGLYSDQIREWNAWSIGEPKHSPKITLWGTSPDGTTLRAQDLTQYVTEGSLSRGVRTNVYQIIALPDKDAVCIVRDWYGAFVDAGELEHHAYPVIEIRKRSDLTILVSRVEFFEDRTTYNAGDESDPIITRTYDQYVTTASFQGKGSGLSTGPWIMWSHIVKNNVTGVNYCNKVRLYFENPGSTPTVYRNSTFVENSATNVVDSMEKQHTVNYVDSFQVMSTGSFDGTNWYVSKAANA